MPIHTPFSTKPDELIPRFRAELRDNHGIWTCEGVGKEEKEIFHPDDVEKFWTEEYSGKDNSRLKLLCKALSRKDQYKRLMEKLQERRLLILSVMVYCEWPSLEHFVNTVLHPGIRRKDISNRDIPLSRNDVATYLGGDTNMARDFERNQWAFKPIIIGSTNSYESDRQRLPFLAETIERIGSGAFATVMKVEVPGKFIEDRLRVHGQEKYEFAWKKFTTGRPRDFVQELENLEKLKRSRHEHMTNHVAAFSYGDSAGILFPLAVCNLYEFILGNAHHDMRQRLLQAPQSSKAIVTQMSKLAEAIRHLHENVKGENREPYDGVHGDLHLKNIVIATSPTTDFVVGEWKIIDFGLSRIRQIAAPGYPSYIPGATEPSVCGLHPPPEIVVGPSKNAFGPHNDIYSFGCILATILAFLLGHQPGAEAFEKRKEGPFYDIVGGKAVRKASVSNWLAEMKARHGQVHPWVSHMVDLINRCTTIRYGKRPKAAQVVVELDEIVYKGLSTDPVLPSWDPAEASPVQSPRGMNTLGILSAFQRTRSDFFQHDSTTSSRLSPPRQTSSSSATSTLKDSLRGLMSPTASSVETP